MAIDPSAEYPGQVDTSDPTGYPLGAAQDITVPGDGTGTPFQKLWLSDLWGFLQALLASVGASPSGTPDKVGASQYLSAIQSLTTTAINAVSLQAAYARSVALSQIAPHINVANAAFQVGGTADVDLLRVENSNQTTTAKNLASGGTLAVAGNTTLTGTATLASVASLLITGAGAGAAPRALIQTSGVGGEKHLNDGLWTPVVKAVTGTNVDIADFTTLVGHWSRVGEIVTFAFHATVDTTSWSGTATFSVDLPVSGTLTRFTAVVTTTQVCESTNSADAGGADAIFTLNGALGSVGTGRKVSVVGQYRLA